MSYLVYDKEGELIDIIDIVTPEELNLYKHDNPQYEIELAKNIDDRFLVPLEVEFEEDDTTM